MKSLFYQSLFLTLCIVFGYGTTFSQGQQPARETKSQDKEDWWEMMQDPNANFFETQKAFYEYWSKNTYTKGSMYKVFKRWEYIMRGRVDKNGNYPKPDQAAKEYYKFKQSFPESVTATWSPVGPVGLPSNNTTQPNGMGRINGIGFHPTDANIYYVAAASGGVWWTGDDGANWGALTDNLPTLGASCVVVDHTNPAIIYFGSGDRDSEDAPGMGVFKSWNSGGSFSQDTVGMGLAEVNQLIMHPTNHLELLAATNKGIYKTTNGGDSWSRRENYYYHKFKDIKYKPGDPLIVYAVEGGSFFRSTNGGDTWGKVTLGIVPSQRLVIGVSPAQPNWVYLCSANPTFSGLLKSFDSGASFNTMSNSPNILGYAEDGSDDKQQSMYDLAIEVNPSNANQIYIGGINIWRSNNGGITWEIVNFWEDIGDVHADIHSLNFNSLNGLLYCGNDGGLHKTSNGTDWTDISSGLAISQIYRIGQSNYQQGHVMCGYQDNGSTESNGSSFITQLGGDGFECIIDWADDERTYMSNLDGDNGIQIYRNVSTGLASIGGYGSGNGIDEMVGWEVPYILDRTTPNKMYSGFLNVWKSTDIDAFLAIDVEWTKISSGETSICNIIAQPQLDDNILYVSRVRMVTNAIVTSPASLKRTENANASSPSWIDCSLPEGNQITDIETHPYDLNIIYATTSSGVYKSYDRGSNWEDISDNLPNVPINCIVQENAGWGTERLYIGTQIGVYYKNENMVHWASFSQGLPVTDVRELEIYHYNEESRIKAATYGRGLWQSPLFSFPDYPTYVQASDGEFPDHVHVTWSPATGEDYYRVYRSSYNNSNYAEPITDWITDLQYDDYNPFPGINQYYWVISSPDEFGTDPSAFNSSDVGYVSPPVILTDDNLFITSHSTEYCTFQNSPGNWCVVGVRGSDPSEFWNIELYSDNTFQSLLATCNYPTQTNYVLLDNNYANISSRGIMVSLPSGSSNARVEFEDGAETMNLNVAQTFEWPAGDVVEVFDIHLAPGNYRFRCNITSGSANLDIALYGSDWGNFNYQDRSQALAYSTSAGGGGNEVFDFEVFLEDDYALVMFSNDNLNAAGYLEVESAGSWLGLYDNNWHNPGNWSMNTVPDATIDVSIPPVANQPWVYAGPASCRNLTIQPGTGTLLRVYNQVLTINGDLTIHRELMMDNPTMDAMVVVNGNVFWKSGSSAYLAQNTILEITGDMVVEEGSLLNANGGSIVFTGSTNSVLTVYDQDCYLPYLQIAKTAASLILSSSTLYDLGINNQLIVYPGASLFTYSNHKLLLLGGLEVLGTMYCNTGITEFQGPSQSVVMSSGSFFRNLIINSNSVILNSDIEVRGDLTLSGGVLSSNAHNINIQGNWINSIGFEAFDESTGRVVFTGGNYPQYCSTETFNILEINKFEGGALRVWGSIVGCAHYDWTAGAIDVNIGYFQANSLMDNGIYGDWYVNPLSFVNLTSNEGAVNLNGNLFISGGQFDVYGGNNNNSNWALEANTGLYMADGILDFHDVGILIVNSPYTFNSIVIGGTIRTSKNFGTWRSGFNPTGGKVELYGPGPGNIGMAAGSFWDLLVNKTGSGDKVVSTTTDITVSNNLDVLKGNFVPGSNVVYVGNDFTVDTAVVQMNSEATVIRVARHYNWNSGSQVQMNAAGTFRALGNWTFAVGSNVNMTMGNVNFLGENESVIYCNESDSKFYNLWINKTGSTPVTIDYYSSDTLNVLGDLLIFGDKNLVSNTPWPVSVQGLFDNDGHYRFNNGQLVLHTPYTISPGEGDYFSTLRLQGPTITPFTFDFSRNDTLRVNLDMEIASGSLNMMNKILAFGRHWNNMEGEAAFTEGAGTVVANGFSGITQNILNDETFHNFTIKPLHASGYPEVSLYGTNRLLNVGHDLVIERGKLVLTPNASIPIGNDFIIQSQGSLYGEGSSALISLPGNWYDYSAAITPETGFTYGTTTVIFNGTPNQYIYQYGSGLSTFYNLEVYKYGGTLSPQCNVEIRGNLSVQNGTYERVDNGHELFLYGNLTTNPGTGFYPRGILRCFGSSNATIAINGNGWLANFVVNKSDPASSVSLLSDVVSMNSGELYVYNGQLDLGSHYYRCTGPINVSPYGKLSIGSDGWLEVGGSRYLNVNGTLEVLGTEGHPAMITHHSGYYDFDVNSGASISASHAVFEYMAAGGLHLWGGSSVDATNSFHNCTFRYGTPGGTLFTADCSYDITANNVNFPTNSNGCTYNVTKTVDIGSITFVESSGAFAGETFENDTYSRVIWGYPEKSLSLMVYLEGLFNTSTGQMNKARNATGAQFEGVKADEIDLELRSANSPYSLVHSVSNLSLNMDGSITTTVPGNFSGSYYLALRQRNHLETWSANPLSFNTSTISYNFTDAASRAFGDNQKELLTNVFGLYAGEVTDDGAISNDDVDFITAQAAVFTRGYVPADVNGDGVVDALDLILIDNNAANSVSATRP